VPDPIFADSRLAVLYDVFDHDRSDLDVYARIVVEFGASTVLDVGCGTGTLALMLTDLGVRVVGIDPAAASLEVARAKPGASHVEWILGSALESPTVGVDLAVMTGNVAQVFVTDSEWAAVLRTMTRAVRPDGWFVFEIRDPAARAWERWTADYTHQKADIPGIGIVETWTELIEVALPLVTFQHTFRFKVGSEVLTSLSTLRFRSRSEIEADLFEAGFRVEEVRDAPDRPGKEHVFISRRHPDDVRSSRAD
jgi:SAM-dependent methyltransferase